MSENEFAGSVRTLAEIGEFGVIEQVARPARQGPSVLLGPGDDAAVVAAPDRRVVASMDLLVEGRHFRRDWSTGYRIGRKAAAQNLADIAAMGARPTALLVGLSAPGEITLGWAAQLAAGLAEESALVGASVAGGDTTSGDQIVIAVTALGDLDGRAPVLRSGAHPGDVVAVAGELGWSAAGLELLTRGMVELEDSPHGETAGGKTMRPGAGSGQSGDGAAVSKSAAKAAAKPTDESTANPAREPENNLANKPADKPMNKPVHDLADRSAGTSVHESVTKPAEASANESAGESVAEPATSPAHEPARDPAYESAPELAAELPAAAANGSVHQPVTDFADESADASANSPGAKPATEFAPEPDHLAPWRAKALARHRSPEPPYSAGPAAARGGATAMLDVSDGLLADLGHIAKESWVAIDLDPDLFPIPDELRELAKDCGLDPMSWFLTGGEDHALAGCFPADSPLPDGWQPIGRVTAPGPPTDPRVTVGGVPWPGRQGWDHFAQAG